MLMYIKTNRCFLLKAYGVGKIYEIRMKSYFECTNDYLLRHTTKLGLWYSFMSIFIPTNSILMKN